MRLDSPTQRREFSAFARAVLSSQDEALRERLADLIVPDPFRLRIKVLYSRKPIHDVVATRVALGHLQPLTPNQNAFVTDLRVGRTIKRRVQTTLVFLPTSQKKVIVAVAICTSDDWNDLVRFLDGLYPSLVPIYLSQSELINSVKVLRKGTAFEWELRVREMSASERIDPVEGKKRKSVREWTDEDLDKLVAQVRERRQSINSLRFEFYRRLGDRTDVTPALVSKVTRKSIIEISGRFALAWQTIVADVIDVGARKLAFFSDRSLRDRAYKAAPLLIKYPKAVFSEIAEVRRLVDVLRRYPRSLHAVEHGNPYAFVQVSDRYDGSSFDVWAVDADTITLVPRLRATEAAVERLVHFIFDEFREGDVVDATA